MTDRSARFQNWFQIISNIAIVFGLGLVVYELNQSKQLALVQFINEDFDRLAMHVAVHNPKAVPGHKPIPLCLG